MFFWLTGQISKYTFQWIWGPLLWQCDGPCCLFMRSSIYISSHLVRALCIVCFDTYRTSLIWARGLGTFRSCICPTAFSQQRMWALQWSHHHHHHFRVNILSSIKNSGHFHLFFFQKARFVPIFLKRWMKFKIFGYRDLHASLEYIIAVVTIIFFELLLWGNLFSSSSRTNVCEKVTD